MAEAPPHQLHVTPEADEEEDKCAICLDSYARKTSLSGCTHLYCFECIHRWVTQGASTCPQCKAPVGTLTEIPVRLPGQRLHRAKVVPVQRRDMSVATWAHTVVSDDEDLDEIIRGDEWLMHLTRDGYLSDDGFIVDGDDDDEDGPADLDSNADDLEDQPVDSPSISRVHASVRLDLTLEGDDDEPSAESTSVSIPTAKAKRQARSSRRQQILVSSGSDEDYAASDDSLPKKRRRR